MIDTDDELLRKWHRQMRGRSLGQGCYRNFCAVCDRPLIVFGSHLRKKADLRCDECVRPVCTGNRMSTAFHPGRRAER